MKKRRLLLLFIGLAAICVHAPPLRADLYHLDHITAALFREITVSDAGDLGLVIDSPGTSGSTVHFHDGTVFPFAVYGPSMQGKVGFVGQIFEDPGDADNVGDMHIGVTGTNAGISGSYTGYTAYVANDNDDLWDVAVYVNIGAGYVYSDWATLGPQTATNLTVDFAETDFATGLNEIGFAVRGTFDGANDSPSNPDYFHVSLVPTPAAVIMGILGLSVAGVKLRKFA